MIFHFNEYSRRGGIYCIINKIHWKLYIGSCKEFKSRWRGHLNSLKFLKHKNLHLQAAWNKYGEEAFEFHVIEVINGTIEERYIREQ